MTILISELDDAFEDIKDTIEKYNKLLEFVNEIARKITTSDATNEYLNAKAWKILRELGELEQ